MFEKIIEIVLKKVLKIVRRECSESAIRNVAQFVKFGLVGVSNTVIGYVLYVGTLLILKKLGILLGIDYIVAQTVSFWLSVLWSFYWNNKLV